MNLAEHARRWVDMEPHVGTLMALAANVHSIVEFGVRGGVSTWALLDGLPPDGQMTSVDIDPNVTEWVPDRVTGDPRWTLVIGDDRTAELPEHADLVVIDTSHEYHHTIAELALAEKLGAWVVALHDYMLPDVGDAVHGYVRRNGGTLTVEPSRWGLAVIRR